jgi:transposase
VFWQIAEPVCPNSITDHSVVRPHRWTSGRFTAIVYLLTSGCACRQLRRRAGHVQTAHRRFTQWAKDGLLGTIHRAVLDKPGAAGELGCSPAVLGTAGVWAKRMARQPQTLWSWMFARPTPPAAPSCKT